MSNEKLFNKTSPVLLTLDGAWLIFEPPVAPIIDKARVLAHLQQQLREHNITVEQKGPEHGNA